MEINERIEELSEIKRDLMEKISKVDNELYRLKRLEWSEGIKNASAC